MPVMHSRILNVLRHLVSALLYTVTATSLSIVVVGLLVSYWRIPLFHLLSDSWGNMLRATSQSTLSVILFLLVVPIITFIIATADQLRSRHFTLEQIAQSLRATLIAFLVPLCVVAVVFGWSVIRTIYQNHGELLGKVQALKQEKGHVQQQLDKKRYFLSTTDPGYNIMQGLIRAFMAYRRSIGDGAPCRILFTATTNETQEKYWDLIPLAVIGSNCPNGDLQNIGVKPQDVDAEEAKGEVPGIVVLHAVPDTKGADRLADDLTNCCFPVKRSYTLPRPVSPNDNVIWFQYGAGTKWRFEGQ